MYYRPASRRLLLLAALVLSTHLLLFLLLREDPRVELYASSEELRALEINSSTYAYRAARFNTYIENEPYRSGPGEHGRGVHLKLSEDKMNELINNDGYNSIACSQIALDRSLGNRPAPE
uniref:Putative polypeptide N-acetylgalactosaminyltransferase-like protein 3 n=2 Tax=Schistocephalus solidus TaxID=70667 RepID=A0A0X3Q166_SCHSO